MKWIIIILLCGCSRKEVKPVVIDNRELYRKIDSIEFKGKLDAERSKYRLK